MKTRMNTIARVSMSVLFIVTGTFKITGFEYMSSMMGQIGFPIPDFFLIGAIVIEVVGGLMLLMGYQVKAVASCLILFLLSATAIFHIPQLSSAEAFQMQLTEVLKNISIMAGLLLLIFNEAGKPFSLDITTDIEEIPDYKVKL